MLDDDFLVTPTIRLRLEQEAAFGNDLERDGSGDYFAILCRSNGEIGLFSTDYFVNDLPGEEYRRFLSNLCWNLNRHLRHDGAWICAWTHPSIVGSVGPDGEIKRQPTRFILLWIDHDGCPQFTVENDESFRIMLEASREHWLHEAETGWETWKRLRDVLDPQAGETYMKALGQLPSSGIVG